MSSQPRPARARCLRLHPDLFVHAFGSCHMEKIYRIGGATNGDYLRQRKPCRLAQWRQRCVHRANIPCNETQIMTMENRLQGDTLRNIKQLKGSNDIACEKNWHCRASYSWSYSGNIAHPGSHRIHFRIFGSASPSRAHNGHKNQHKSPNTSGP